MAVDLSRSIRPLLAGAIDRATRYQQAGRIIDAADAWDEAARLAIQLADNAQTVLEKQRRMQTVVEFKQNSERLRLRGPTQRNSSTESPVGEAAAQSQEATEYQASIRALIHRSTVGWEDIAGLDETKRAIQTAYALSLAQAPAGVRINPVRNILFYGPPGCGKSLLAAATSRGLDATFFNVKVSSLLSKYFGESSKLVTSLYAEARANSPSVIFLDEVDALTGNRDGHDSGAERRMLANLLSELDGVSEKGDRRFVLTIAATNTPWSIDPAILSRFERSVFIPLPDQQARLQILKLQLVDRGYELTVPVEELAVRLNGFSGREIERFAKQLVDEMIQHANPDLTRFAVRGRAAIEGYRVRVNPINLEMVNHVLGSLKPETPDSLLIRYQKFADAK